MAKLNRRQFIQNAGYGVSAAALASTPGLTYAQMTGQSAPFTDYKALVCVFLFGGNDSYNMLVPRSQAEYDVYAASRQNLAIPRDDLLAINPLNPDGTDYGLHPSMARLQGLFEGARAGLVTNMGPLVEPTTKDQFFNESVALPPQLFSHNDQQDQWHSLKGAATTKTGWAGRVADLIQTEVAAQQLATGVSLFGSTAFLSGDDTIPYIMGPGGPLPFAGFGDSGIFLEQRLAFERIVSANYDSVYERAFADVQRRAVSTADIITTAIDNAPPINTAFPQSQLGTQLQTVARLIAIRDQLQMERQVFFVATGGFDSHDNQNEDQPGLLSNISECLGAFYDATVELGVASSVTSFTQSDFGRTLTSNGDGTDHAWGGNQIVVGDAVAGRTLYGTYPLLEIGGDDDVAGGRLIPTTSADQYAATLAKWFGVADADLGQVAPNLANFAQQDLGFMI